MLYSVSMGSDNVLKGLKADLRRYGTPNSASNVFKADKAALRGGFANDLS